MVRCPECGYSNTPDSKVCKKCGSRVEGGADQASSSPTPPAGGGAMGGSKTVAGSGATGPAWDEGTPQSPQQSGGAPAGGAKTIVGNASNMPAWDEGAPAASDNSGGGSGDTSEGNAPTGNVIKCPSCGFYPLREAVSESSPCPNCGNKGATAQAGTADNAKPDAPAAAAAGFGAAKGGSKTMRLSDLTPEDEEEPAFVLVEERSQKSMEFEGESTTLNRENLDKDNMSLSGTEHAKIYQKDGQWFIQDRSSNGATFVQVQGEIPLENGTKILLGNKIFTFKSE